MTADWTGEEGDPCPRCGKPLQGYSGGNLWCVTDVDGPERRAGCDWIAPD